MPLSRRTFCWGALALVGATGTVLVTGCSGDGSDEEATGGDGGDSAGAGSGDIDLPGEGDAPVMFSSPTCGCCGQYAPYLGDNGYEVEVRQDEDLTAVKRAAGIPAEAESCHTTMIEGYAIEGHVPVESIDRLRRERPAVDGIALPGMPSGSPGMSGDKTAPFEIVAVKDGAVEPYMTV